MATIITVHGTNAGDEKDEGERWWQKGSVFEKHIRELVTGEDGELTFQPHHWNGANSEVSRQKAGEELFETAKQFDARKEPYCLLGHSHGGSVISHALLKASSKKNPLTSLQQWITIATPFINARKHKLLYSRLGFYGKSLLLTCFLCTTFILYGLLEEYENFWVVFLGLTPILLVYIVIKMINYRNLFPFRAAYRNFYQKQFLDRWNCFYHKNDEAMQGLRVIKDISYDIFSRQFAVPIAMRAALFIPLIIIMSPYISQIVHEFINDNFFNVPSRNVYLGGELITFNIASIMRNAIELIDISADTLEVNLLRPLGLLDFISSPYWSNIYFILSMIFTGAVLFIISSLCIFAAGFLGTITSFGLSIGLNRLTWGQVRKLAFGDDAIEARALAAHERPAWVLRASSPLPDALDKQIAQFSDKQASKSLSKFRNAISHLGFSEKDDHASVFAEYLTWKELIHNSYFDIPAFRKLVAYAIEQSDGFRATDKFKNDPDYGVVAKWYEEIQPQVRAGSGMGSQGPESCRDTA